MRVITGSAKGYGLKAPKHMNLRPTPSRVKEAIFSSLANEIPKARVLDLFAGTGAFAIETLSRGAESAALVEKDARTVKLIQDNLRKTRLQEKARVLRLDVRQALPLLAREGARFEIIFADPPYEKGTHVSTSSRKNLKHQDTSSLRDSAEPERERDRSGDGAKSDWLGFLLNSPELQQLLVPEGILLIERFKKDEVKEPHRFQYKRDFRFGDSVVSLFQHIG
jgi:16S rRNA (guanine966-N2)-methyltransferase